MKVKRSGLCRAPGSAYLYQKPFYYFGCQSQIIYRPLASKIKPKFDLDSPGKGGETLSL